MMNTMLNPQHLSMEFISGIYAATAAFVFLFCYYLLSSKPKKAPPEAGGARLFTGHLHLMDGGSGNLPHINLGAVADKCGPIFTIRLGVHRALVVSSSELTKELFTTNDTAVLSRPKLRIDKYFSRNYAMFGFSPYSPYWCEIRKLVSAELLSARRLELQRSVRVAEASQFINELYRHWETEKDESGKAMVDMKQWFGNLALNMLLRVVVGKRFHGGDTAEEARRCRRVMREYFYLVGLVLPGDAMPYLRWLDIGGYEKRMKKTAKELEKMIGEWFAEHRKREYSGEDKPQDFMDVMLSVVKDNANLQGQYDADTIVKATCQTLISGGSDITTVTLIWILSLLLNNRRALREAQAELDQHVGRERQVQESDTANLVYLQAVVKESLRLYPGAPLGGARVFARDCNVGGYRVPKGTWLAVNMWKLHRDPRVWPEEPLEFRPERFLGGPKNGDIRGQNFELMPFGSGRRMCPGMNFALSMVHLVLARLLQGFDFSTVDDVEVDMTESAGLSNFKITPLDVLIAPRLSDLGLY